MDETVGGMQILIRVLLWIGLAALVAVAIWTVVRAPGRKHDPGRKENR